MTGQQLIAPTDAFAELDRLSFAEMPLEDALARIAGVAGRAVPDVCAVSVTLLGQDGAHTAAYTGETALHLDEWQYENGHGPCLAAAEATVTVGVSDTAGHSRWPAWADRAVDAGVHSWASASDHLVLEQARGIIMAERHCPAEEALGVLKQMAAELHRTVIDVAKVLVARAGWPSGA